MQISFVIPVYNQVSHTKCCLQALAEHLPGEIAHEIILVNDGSSTATRTFLDALPTFIRVAHLPQNQGFARATNHGAQLARGRWLCLLNNDVTLTPGSLEPMLAAAAARPDTGIIGNVQVSAETGEVDHAGIHFIDGGYPRHRRPPLAAMADEPDVAPAAAVTAACCLVDRAWFLSVGGLDCGYQNGFEDVDLCLRAREAGWGIYVANRSVVHHAVSASEGRGRCEYRNAQRFLQRWGPRTAALEADAARRAARDFQTQRVPQTDDAAAPAAVRAARQRQREKFQQRRKARQRTPRVWVDLLRMEPKGANGGIKPLLYGLLREMEQVTPEPLQFVLLAQKNLREELQFLSPASIVATRDPAGWQVATGSAPPLLQTLSELAAASPPDVLYCPFGTSEFSRPDLPTVALLVDALHRDLPAALPIEEVNFREDNFKRIIGSATWIQTLAQHGIERLQHHYGLHPTRCFHTYAAVHRQVEESAPLSAKSSTLPSRPFFFYPANFWPHKNHEVLLTAYHLYQHQTGDAAWDLLLTGHPDRRMHSLKKMSDALGLAGRVHFPGHLPDPDFRRVWRHAGALVFPSLHEGFGIPLVEAFQAGLPVAAAQTSVLPEVGGEACAWFDPRDPAQVAATLTTLAADADGRAALRAKGQARLARFSLRYEARRLHHFLNAAARDLVP